MESRTQRSKPRPMIQKNPRPRPRTDFSRPRTGMLKAKDTRRKFSPKRKKKVFAPGNANFQVKVKKAHGHGSFSTIYCPRPRAGHFRGLAGFKAKDLTFEAKAKDFKMCHRGPGLCYLGFLAAIFNEKIAQQMRLFPRSLNSD